MTEFVTATYKPKRSSDEIAELIDALAFQRKVNHGLLATIDRLEGELAQAREDANRVLLTALGSPRK